MPRKSRRFRLLASVQQQVDGRAISGTNCVVCAKVNSILGNGYADQDWIVGGKVEVVQAHSEYSVPRGGFYQVLINIRQDAYEFRRPNMHRYLAEEGLKSGTVQMIEATYAEGEWFANDAVTLKRPE
ncbi:DUF6318 family protein [Arthrobacter sp. ZGTC212]|uniref:DUF6318 family protein n=1 Tax=Arthrobacter sp. ZGTC212 TaxID=2058899 RepID=UPI00215806DE|nr:DUF6318 family protein [Arthrobacter sp. ZGTC212]